MCVLDHTGTIYCWGKDNAGQLGDSGTLQRTTPIRVDGLGGPTAALFSDNEVSYAFTRAGSVYRWGRVSLSTSSSSVLKPAEITSMIPNAVSVGGGASHHCALNTDHTVSCWGGNNVHQLGENTDGYHDQPTPVPLLDAVSTLAVGYEHTCASMSDGSVWCWGDNHHGQLGSGTLTQVDLPTQANLSTAVTQVATRNDYTCALTGAGSVWCWGREGYGDNQGNPVPHVIADLGSDVESIALGNWHVCAKKADGSLWCWHQGLAFDGDTPPVPSTTPAAIAELGTDVARVWTGYKSTCALRKDGTLWCWGTDLGLSVAPTQIAAGCN